MLKASHAKRLPLNWVPPGLLSPAGHAKCLCQKSCVLFATSHSTPNGQISDTVATSVANGRIIKHENRLRLRHVFVRNAKKVSSLSMVGIASALSSAGAKPDPGVTIKRGKRRPQRSKMMSQESRTAVKTETEQKKKRLTVNLPPETHHAFKVWCTQQGREMSEIVVEFVHECLKKQSK